MGQNPQHRGNRLSGLPPPASACCCAASAPASSASVWQPQISGKILVLPQNQLERAIQRDFAASPLASDMLNVDQQIASEVTNIQSLNESRHLYEETAAIEARHQVLAAKRAYIGLMGEQIRDGARSWKTKLRLTGI